MSTVTQSVCEDNLSSNIYGAGLSMVSFRDVNHLHCRMTLRDDVIAVMGQSCHLLSLLFGLFIFFLSRTSLHCFNPKKNSVKTTAWYVYRIGNSNI